MNRRNRTRRRPLRVEPLESRALLSSDPAGLDPTPDPSRSLFVRFAATVAPGAATADLAAVRGAVVRAYPDGPDLVTLGSGEATAAAIARLRADPGVLYAQADSIIHAESIPILPNDPVFAQSAGLNSVNNADIDAPEGWGISTGNPATIVAVIDTGIDLNNPDFAGKIWTNPVDDAASGYPGDVHGWNFVSDNSNVQDDNGHGSHVSGIIAAAGDNGYGTVGVDWNAQIMPLKFLDKNGNGSTDLAVDAIYYAVAHGAKVINASWGGSYDSPALYDAIAYAGAHNVVFVTAAGNDGTDNDFLPSYPANYVLPDEISVASTDANGNLSSFSNYGPRTVDLAAPGEDVTSDVPTSISPDGLATYSGTSMSTAYVSGVVALVAGVDPQFTAGELVSRVESTVKPEPGLAGLLIAGGIVDAYNALLPDAARIANGVAPAGEPTLGPGSTDAQVRSAILASPEFLAAHGGDAQGFIDGLYEDLLGRAPDPGGLANWEAQFVSGTTSRYQIAEAILNSYEGRAVEVAHWYRDDLGRAASIGTLESDPGVLAWAGELTMGLGDDTVQDAILSSPEYLDGHGGTPPLIVDGFYGDLEDRQPSPTEQSSWAGLFYGGTTPDVVLRYFQGSPEVLQTKVARWFISDLGRPETVAQLKADPGVQGWATLLTNE